MYRPRSVKGLKKKPGKTTQGQYFHRGESFGKEEELGKGEAVP